MIVRRRLVMGALPAVHSSVTLRRASRAMAAAADAFARLSTGSPIACSLMRRHWLLRAPPPTVNTLLIGVESAHPQPVVANKLNRLLYLDLFDGLIPAIADH